MKNGYIILSFLLILINISILLTKSDTKSWILYNDSSMFPIENLPFSVGKDKDTNEVSCYSRIDEYTINLSILEKEGLLDDAFFIFDKNTFNQHSLNKFISLGRQVWTQVRKRLTEIFSDEKYQCNTIVQLSIKNISSFLPILSLKINGYTDFYTSKNHAFNIGSLFRPDNPLLPNWYSLPIGYHGRTSSIIIDGTEIKLPKGQVRKLSNTEKSSFGYLSFSNKLDFEVEVGFVIGKSNDLGENIHINQAEDYIFGYVLINDWSARDIQEFEYIPLGPFTSKNFATTISSWIVVKDALEVYKIPLLEKQIPIPLEYLYEESPYTYDIQIDVYIIREEYKNEEIKVSSTNLKYIYWSFNQMITHHTISGCKLEIGDILATGTLSGTSRETYGCLMEMNKNGKESFLLDDKYNMTWLKKGDTVKFKAYTKNLNDVIIGLGECKGRIV